MFDNEKEIYARGVLEGASNENPNIARDCWENSRLITVKNQPDAFMKLINDIEQNGEGLLPSMHGALALYFRHEFGVKEYEKLMDKQSFRKNVIEGFL